jgi:hypothetical protein
MIIGRLLMRLLLVPMGAGFAVFAAALVTILPHWNRFVALVAAHPDAGDDWIIALAFYGPAVLFMISVSAVAMMLPAVIGVLLSEAFAIRTWIFHAVNGALSAWVGQMTMLELSEPFDFYSDVPIAIGAGIAAGFAYWIVAGWSAGFWKPVFGQKEPNAAPPVASA